MKTTEKAARVDVRLTQEQREFFEYAAGLGHFRTMTEFMIHSMQQVANAIVKEHETVLATQKDKDIFFDAIINPPKANAALKEAVSRYKDILGAK